MATGKKSFKNPAFSFISQESIDAVEGAEAVKKNQGEEETAGKIEPDVKHVAEAGISGAYETADVQ